jgi:hypothetical protein
MSSNSDFDLFANFNSFESNNNTLELPSFSYIF